MTQPDWPVQLTRTIAGEVRRIRTDRGMSAQQLSDRCAKRGLEISRTTIADLENGRRAVVSVGELLVLAAALNVPPLVLVIPLGRQPEIEILPDVSVSTWRAAGWWRGDEHLAIDPELSMDGTGLEGLAMFQLQNQMAAMIKTSDVEHPEQVVIARNVLVGVRKMMRGQGLIPPPLPQGLAYIDTLADPGGMS